MAHLLCCFGLLFLGLLGTVGESRAQSTERHRIEMQGIPPARGGGFGYVIHAHADWLFASWAHTINGPDVPRAIAFRREGGDWVERQVLLPQSGATPYAFSSEMATDGEWLYISDLLDSSAGLSAGRVEAFRLNSGVWTATGAIVPSAQQPIDHYGQSLATSAGRLAVSAPGSDHFRPEVGAVFVMRSTGATWTEEAILEPANHQALDLGSFGMQLAMDEDEIVASAILFMRPAGVRAPGALLTYHRTSAGWQQTGMLHSPLNVYESAFGWADIRLEGEWLVAGDVPQWFHGMRGRVQVFRRSPSGPWQYFQTLLGQPGNANDGFGARIELVDGRLFVASGARHLGNPMATGFIFEYGFDGTQWTLVRSMTSSDTLAVPSTAGKFPYSIAATENWVIGSDVTAPNPTAAQPGRLYAFEFPVGSRSCVGAPGPNFISVPLIVSGSRTAGLGALDFHADHLWPGSLAMLLAAPAGGWVVAPGGSVGVLCLGSGIRRVGESVASADSQGDWNYDDHVLGGPGMVPLIPIQAGETWHFQLWYRQPGPASNFSDAVAVPFR